MSDSITGNIIRRAALLALGTMLPREEVFQHHLRHVARGVTFLVCGGVIVTAIFISLLWLMYLALVEQGLSVLASGIITGIFALAGAAISFLLAERSLNRAAQVTQQLHLKAPALPKVEASIDLQQGAQTLLNAFLDGIRGDSEDAVYLKRRHKELLARLAELEAELTEAEEAEERPIMEVVQEYDSDKDIIRFRPRDHAS